MQCSYIGRFAKNKLFLLILCSLILVNFSASAKGKGNQNQDNKRQEEKTSSSSEDDAYYFEFFKNYFEEVSTDFSSSPYYELGISPWSTFEEIKARYKELIKKYHPDKSGSDSSDKFMRIQKAYEKIKNKRKIKNEEDFEESRLNNILSLSIDGLFNIIILTLVLYVFKFFTNLFAGFINYIWIKCIEYYCSQWIINTFFSHLIKDYNHMIVYTIIITLALDYIKSKIFR